LHTKGVGVQGMIGDIFPLLPSIRKEEWAHNEGVNPIGEPAWIEDKGCTGEKHRSGIERRANCA
jgi:hypothetical protein